MVFALHLAFQALAMAHTLCYGVNEAGNDQLSKSLYPHGYISSSTAEDAEAETDAMSPTEQASAGTADETISMSAMQQKSDEDKARRTKTLDDLKARSRGSYYNSADAEEPTMSNHDMDMLVGGQAGQAPLQEVMIEEQPPWFVDTTAECNEESWPIQGPSTRGTCFH